MDHCVEIIGSVFTGVGGEGDFRWMIEQPEYGDALFIFNDNEEQFLIHYRDPTAPVGCSPGGGNAIIRPFQCRQPPRAVGIPTGAGGAGYDRLTDEVQATIEMALERIREILAPGRYHRLYYSADEQGGLGTGIFEVDEAVKKFIVKGIRSLG